MRLASWLGLATVALVTASCAPYTYDTGVPRSGADYSATTFNGTWRLLSNRAYDSRNWLDERSRFDSDDWRTGDRTYARADAWFLPDEFRISGGRDLLRIEDEDGSLIAEIPLDSDYRYGSYGDQPSRNSRGHWVNDRQFEVTRDGRNRRLTQTFTVRDRGRRLEVVTRIERDGGTRSYTREYGRV
jgi:hypothetical protein